MKRRNVVLLGSTGSIGRNAVKVLTALSDRFRVTGLVARSSISLLAEQANFFRPELTVTTDPAQFGALRAKVDAELKCSAGSDPVIELVTAPETDIVLCAIVGTGGLEPVIAALRAGKRVALASKEVLVMAGEIVAAERKRSPGGELIPVDSEHSAIFQCLAGRPPEEVKRLLLTASGGAFRDRTRAEMERATLEDALAHPTWSMGPKVTIDSATMMNKGFEIIEAFWLFGLPVERIDVVVHPESIVHSLVEFSDGATLAQLAPPDMRVPIQYAFTWPERLPAARAPLDLVALGALTFRAPDETRFPALRLAKETLRAGRAKLVALSAADEIAVARFRRGEIRFGDIVRLVADVVERTESRAPVSVEDVLALDGEARARAAAWR